MQERIVCAWTLELWDDAYTTACGKTFMVNDGTPEENDMHFCAFCGKPLASRVEAYSNDEE
jgi:rRNA maturation endonuclease Nob1